MKPIAAAILVFLALLTQATAAPAQRPTGAVAADAARIDTMALRAHTYFLAHDLLEGRGTGTRGERAAAVYLARRLEALGLAGGAAGGRFLQPVPLVRAVLDTARTRLTLASGAGSVLRFSTPRDFLLNTGGPGAFRDFTGEAVFVGGVDDALALSPAAIAALRGKVVVLDALPGGALGALVPEWRRAGVAGVILPIRDPERYALYVASRGEARYYVDAELEEPVWQPDLPVLLAGPALLDALGVAPASDTTALPLALGARLEVSIEVEREYVAAANVLGLLPGSHPERSREVVVYTAHYDHLGISTPDETGDSIYNGFSDNAAGVAMLLAIARALRDEPPERSILFAFFTGEERGLLGSSYFVAEPPLPVERFVAAINLDAGAPPAPPVSWRVAGGSVSTLGEAARNVAESHGWATELGPPAPNSDYWGFLTRGVPAVFIIPGEEWQGVSAAERDRLRTRWDRYHRPGDEWHPDFPFAGLARYARFALEVGEAVASGPARPHMSSRD